MVKVYLQGYILIVMLMSSFCKGQSSKSQFQIAPKLIFSEKDSFLVSTNHLQHNRSDYFLIKANIIDSSQILPAIDSFVQNYNPKQYLNYDNYTMYFYKESDDVNEMILKKFPGSEYKIFLDSQKDLLLVYQYYLKKLFSREVGNAFR